MMFGGGVGLYVRRVGAGRCSSCSSISKALQMGMESDMEYAQGLSWTFRVPNGCKVADGGLQGLARVVCRFSPTGGLCNEFGNGSFGIRRTSLRIGSTPQIPWFRSCHRLEACFLRMSTARYLIIRYWQFRRQMVGKVGRMGPAGMFAVDGRRALPMPVHRSNEHISGEHLPQPGLLCLWTPAVVVGMPHLVSRNFGECYPHFTKSILL